MPTRTPLDIAVVGAGLTGLSAALMLARDGHRVTVIERDPDPPPPDAHEAWASWQRPGINQFRQPHLMLPRWYHDVAAELPDLLAELTATGVEQVNLLHRLPASLTHGWQPGDEQFDTITARRPVLEAALARLAASDGQLRVIRGRRVTGLLHSSGAGRAPQVLGVQTDAAHVPADLVVDAAGRRTRLPRWVGQMGGRRPVDHHDPAGFVYFSRHFRATEGRYPASTGPIFSHLPSMSVLTVPGDQDTFSIVLVTRADDHVMRELRNPAAWLAAVRCSPVAAHWLAGSEPATAITPIAGIEDVQRSYIDEHGPVATGIIAIGDAACATNPALGRGASIGLMHARILRDVLHDASSDPSDVVAAVDAEVTEQVGPYVQSTMQFTRHRLAEMSADIAGIPYQTDDPSWPMTTTLLNGADRDPVLARAAGCIAGLLASAPEVFSDPLVWERLGPFIGAARYPDVDISRDDLVQLIETAGEQILVGRPRHNPLIPTTHALPNRSDS